MKKALALVSLLSCPVALAETAPAPQPRPAAPATTTAPKLGAVAPAASKPVTTAPAAPAAPKPAATPVPAVKPAAPVPVPATTATAPTAATGSVVAPPAPAPLTPEQRRQLELLSNAERIDKANRELLARTQELQLTNENLDMQLNIIRHDKSSEGIWKGALAVIAGFLMGWFFATSSRRKSSW